MGVFSKIFSKSKTELQDDFDSETLSNENIQQTINDSVSGGIQENTEPSPFLVDEDVKEKK